MKVYNSEQEKLADLLRQAELVQSQNQADLQKRAEFSPRNDEISRLKSLNPMSNPGDLETQAVQNVSDMSNEEKLQKYLELHPEYAPKKAPEQLDPQFLSQMSNLTSNHPMSIDPNSNSQLASPDLPPQQPSQQAPRPVRIPQSDNIPSPQESAPMERANSGQELANIMFGQNRESTVENLKKAQQTRDNEQESAKRDRLAALLGSSASGVKNEYLLGEAERKDKGSGQAIEDLEKQTAAQKSDPTSAVSQGYRDMMKQFGVNIQGDASAQDIEKIAPWIEKAYNAEENRNQQKDLMKYKYKELGTLAKLKGDEKASIQEEKDFENLVKETDPNRARSGEKGKNQARLNAAGRVTGLIDSAGGNPSKIPMRELATTVANMLTMGGQTAVQQINELVPHTLSGDAAGIQEWLTGNPTGTDQQKFVQMYSKIAQREAKVARDQLRDAQFSEAYSREHLKKRNPERFYKTLSTATDLDPEEIKAMEAEPGFRGRYKSSNYSEGQEKGIQRVMDSNKVSRPEAIKALQKAGKL